jgi:hypothetical protein
MVHPALHHHLLIILCIIYFQCTRTILSNPSQPFNRHQTIVLPPLSKWSSNTIKTGCQKPNSPSLIHTSLSSGIWTSLPSPAHVAALKKRLSHASLKKQRPIGSTVSVKLKQLSRVQPIKSLCENILRGYLYDGDLVFAILKGIYSFQFPQKVFGDLFQKSHFFSLLSILII